MWGAALLGGLRDACGAAQAGPADAAVAVGVLGQVLLVVVLRVEELVGIRDLGRDLAVSATSEHRLERVTGLQRRLLLRVRGHVDRRAVLRADVIPLPHPLRRVVRLPEQLEQVGVRHLGRVEDDLHDLGMARAGTADLVVRRVGRVAALVTDRRRKDAVGLPELALRTPEATQGEVRRLQAGRVGRLERGVQDEVALRH